jgi:hypothetical protein
MGMYEMQATSVMGDDAVILAKGITPEIFAKAADVFGVVANPEKQMFEIGTLQYLQRLHIRDHIGGIASTMRALSSSENYERLSVNAALWNPYVDIARWIAIIENCVFNPAFTEFACWMKTLDRYELGADIDPNVVLAKAGETGREAILKDVGSAHKSGLDQVGTFAQLCTNGAIRGEALPPWGTVARFERAYGKRLEGKTDSLLQ